MPTEPPKRMNAELARILAKFEQRGEGQGSETPEPATKTPPRRRSAPARARKPGLPQRPPGRYENNLAEFPMFRFSRKGHRKDPEPIIYEDTIKGKEGKPVSRHWECYPGRYGFGGAFAQKVLFILFQLYNEQGACGDWIHFGTQRQLLRRLGYREFGKTSFRDLRRAIDTLRGYDFHCKNAFWDRDRQAYIDKRWSLFGDVEYAHPRADTRQEELPFCRIQVSPVLQQIGQSGGFFGLGFSEELFLEMGELEARASIYLSKWFMTYPRHWRLVEDIARLWPIEDKNPRKVRLKIRQTCDSLIERGLPILDGYELEKTQSGDYRVTFHRKEKPKGEKQRPALDPKSVAPHVHALVEDMIELTNSPHSRTWFAHCATVLGSDQTYRAISECRDWLHQNKPKTTRGAVLTGFLNELAKQQGKTLKREDAK